MPMLGVDVLTRLSATCRECGSVWEADYAMPIEMAFPSRSAGKSVSASVSEAAAGQLASEGWIVDEAGVACPECVASGRAKRATRARLGSLLASARMAKESRRAAREEAVEVQPEERVFKKVKEGRHGDPSL